MKAGLKWILLSIVTLSSVVTCCNVQAIRDVYAASPSPIEMIVVGAFQAARGD